MNRGIRIKLGSDFDKLHAKAGNRNAKYDEDCSRHPLVRAIVDADLNEDEARLVTTYSISSRFRLRRLPSGSRCKRNRDGQRQRIPLKLASPSISQIWDDLFASSPGSCRGSCAHFYAKEEEIGLFFGELKKIRHGGGR
jgi:hypothetical protein